MKRLANYLIAMALVVFTFTSCEDVPSPFGNVVPPVDDTEKVTFEPSGSGTAADPYNVQAALDAIAALATDASTDEVYAEGYVTSITELSTQYGNATFIISDDETGSNSLTVYRAKGLNNQSITDENLIKQGDKVVVCGKLVNFKGNTPEFTQGCYIYSINGAGGAGGDEPSGEAKGTGTLDDPYNALGAIAYAKTVGETESANDVYIKGKVAAITDQYGTQYGNATFTISDDGNAENTFTVFRALYLGNKKYESGDLIKVGDDVVICGKVTNYKGNTPETVQGKAYLYSLNGVTDGGGSTDTPTGGASGTGTQEDPFNVQAIIDYVSALAADTDTNQDYYVKGIVTSIPDGNNGISTQYNNVSFYISDDAAGSNKFYVFRAKGLNGGDVTADVIKVGDEVVIFGSTWVNYKGNTPETKQGAAYIVSVNGSGSGNGGGNNDPGNEPSGSGDVTRDVSGTVLTLTNTAVTASSNTITVDLNEQNWANAEEVTTVTLSDGTTITFDKGEGSTTPKYYTATKGVRLYAKNTIAIKGASKAIAKAVLTCDSYQGTDYVGNATLTASASGTTMTIVNEHTSASGGTQLRVQTIEITYAD